MNKFYKVLGVITLCIFSLSMHAQKEVIKVKGESGTEYRIVLEPNTLPYCSCPSYEYQSFPTIKGCCKHLYKLFYIIDVDETKYNWASRQ